MRNTSILLMLLTVLTKCFGLAREKALAHFFGTSPMASIFLVAFSLPMVLSNLFVGTIASGYIPIYNQVNEAEGKEEAYRFTSNLSNILALMACGISLLAILFTRQLVGLLSPGFEGQVLETTIFMSRITAISVFLSGVASIFKAYLQIQSHFFVSMFHSVIMNICLIIGMYLGRDQNPMVLALGILAAFVFQYIIFLPYIRKTGFRYSPVWEPANDYIKKFLVLIIPILISTSVLELNLIVNKAIASEISLSGISIINYATKIQGFITGIVVTSIITVTYPQMSRFVEEGRREELPRVFGESLSLMALLVVPASLGIIVFSEEVVHLLFYGGAFGREDVLATGRVLMFYGLGLLGIGVREIAIRIFYSLKETKAPIWNSVFMVGANIFLSIFLSKYFGLVGLAMGTSLSLILGAIGILIQLRGHLPSLGLRERLVNLGKIILASVIMIGLAYFAFGLLKVRISPNLALLLSIALGGLVYLGEIVLMKIEEFNEIKKLIKRKSRS